MFELPPDRVLQVAEGGCVELTDALQLTFLTESSALDYLCNNQKHHYSKNTGKSGNILFFILAAAMQIIVYICSTCAFTKEDTFHYSESIS